MEIERTIVTVENAHGLTFSYLPLRFGPKDINADASKLEDIESENQAGPLNGRPKDLNSDTRKVEGSKLDNRTSPLDGLPFPPHKYTPLTDPHKDIRLAVLQPSLWDDPLKIKIIMLGIVRRVATRHYPIHGAILASLYR